MRYFPIISQVVEKLHRCLDGQRTNDQFCELDSMLNALLTCT